MFSSALKLFSVITFFLLFSGTISYAQLKDTVVYSLHQKPKFFITLASFNTFIDNDYASINGIRMGVNYNQRIRIGLGYFNLTNNDVVSTIHPDETNLNYDTPGNLHFGFVSLSGEYFFFNQYPWRCGISPLQLGFGKAKYEYVNGAGKSKFKTFTASESVIIYQPEASVQYNIFKWFGAGVSTGYRFTLLRSRKSVQHLNAPTFSFDIRFFLDELYKLLFSDDEVSQKNEKKVF